MLVTIYSSGGIKKGNSDDKKLCWSGSEEKDLSQAARPHEIIYMRPDDPLPDLSDNFAVFGRDLCQIQLANFIVVDARERRGIGIGVEMAVARVLGTPLLIVVPRNSHYRKDSLSFRGSSVDNYVHPHIGVLADGYVETFEEAGRWIKDYLDAPKKVKGVAPIFEAIEAYKSKLLHQDPPMLEVFRALNENKD